MVGCNINFAGAEIRAAAVTAAETAWTDLTEITSCFKNITKRNQYLRIVRVARNMAVSVDHNSTMSDLRDFIKENNLKITTSGPGRTKDKILAEIKAMTTNEVTDKSSIQELRAYIQMKKLDIKTAGKGRTKAVILEDIKNIMV